MRHVIRFVLCLCLGTMLIAGAALADSTTFKVNLKVMQQAGFFNPATQTVHVRGGFNSWGDGSPMFDADGDFIYEGKFEAGTTSPVGYKFVVKEGSSVNWEDHIGDRQLVLTGSEQVLDPVEWTNGIRFKVNMAAPLNTGLFNPTTQFVSIMGGFNAWAAGDSLTARKYELKDGNADQIYDAVVSVGDFGNKFKFTIHNNSDGKVATWEGHADRSIDLTTSTLARPENIELPWDGDPGVAVTGTVLFQVNIAPLRDSGIFDETEGDTLQLRGEFNNWSDANPELSIMQQSPIDGNLYEIAIPITKVPGAVLNYKFYVKFNFNRALWAGITGVPDWGYEEPGSTGGGNRQFEFTGVPQQSLDPVPYKDVFNYIPDGTTVNYHFVADMRCYLRDAANNGADPATDTLRLHIQDVVWHIFDDGTTKFQDAINLVGVTPFNFSDANGDSIYTLTLPVAGVNQNWMQYKLRWAGTEESGPGFEFGRRRVRYARPDAQGNYATDYQMGVDYFSTTTDPLPIETEDSGPIDDEAPCSVTPVSVEQTDPNAPETYALSNNYPNPFNPSTTFEYSLRKNGRVTITLYNALGQKIADLVNEDQAAGKYKVNVDLSSLSRTSLATGVYFYQIKAGDFTATRRMMFLK